MNPEEGDLRPQLLDRFALSVEIHGLQDPRDRVAIMERNLSYEEDPEKFREKWQKSERNLSKEIEAARELLIDVTYSKHDLVSIAALTSSLHVDGHRADLVILKSARAHAAFEGRDKISDRDIALAAELALPHRLRRGPFQQTEINIDDLQSRIKQIQSEVGGEESDLVPGDDEQDAKKKAVDPH